MSSPQTANHLFQRLWIEHPRVLGVIASGLIFLAVASNPLWLRGTGLILDTTLRPKSGFWMISIVAGLLAVALLVARRRALAGKLVVLLAAATLAIVAADAALRVWPPLEITEENAIPWAQGEPNAWGFLDSEPRPEARVRILVLGDSITWGLGVELGQRYHDIIERRLTNSGSDVDVQSVAMPGWGAGDYLAQYHRFADRFDPELVLLGWCMNAIQYGERADAAGPNVDAEPASVIEHVRHRLAPVARALDVNEWYLWTVATRRLGALGRRAGLTDSDWIDRHNTQYGVFLRRWYDDPASVARAQSDLIALKQACDQADRRIVAVLFPYRPHLIDPDPALRAKARKLFESAGIEYVDLFDDFADRQSARELFYPRDDCHPNQLGHQLAAEQLMPKVGASLEKRAKSKN